MSWARGILWIIVLLTLLPGLCFLAFGVNFSGVGGWPTWGMEGMALSFLLPVGLCCVGVAIRLIWVLVQRERRDD